ncbi:MAG TPA: hypothetical protein VGK18_05095 [Propionicimonas sp.]|jgi:hypothetical protein|uniref:hypothetical protein n=1 Tax=Propionicimonas sp. TaxID=1955623 RepID=UPI002F3F0284
MFSRARLRRASRLWPLLAVLVVIGLVVGLGGFARRTDMLRPAEPGTEIDSHNLVFTINTATLQAVAPITGDTEWKVQVYGLVRNPGDEALAPILGPNGNFVLHDATSGLIAEAETVTLGASGRRALVPPGNTTLPMTIDFTLPAGYAPQAEVELAVAQMEHTANAVLGLNDGELVWNIDSYAPASLLRLPLTRLPDAPR